MFKNYNMNQLTLPLDLEVNIPSQDIAQLIHHFVETIDDREFNAYRSTYGASRFHPKMMLKIVLYGYTQSIFSGRKLENMLHDSIRFQWLAQGQTPTYRTINRFRSSKETQHLIKSSFSQFRTCLLEESKIDGEKIFIDGTKLEANANKFSFVWRKRVEKARESVMKQSEQLYEAVVVQNIIPAILEDESLEVTAETMAEVHTQLTEIETKLSKIIENEPSVDERKRVRQKRSTIRQVARKAKMFSERRHKYDTDLKILGVRNSYSKTDPDATFMRMKDDPMRNGQLKPGYNVQIATNNQYVLSYGVYSNPTDTRTLIPFLNDFKSQHNELPEYIVADAGYGSESNYEAILDDFEKTPIIPYNMYYKEQTKTYQKDVFRTQNWMYDEGTDTYLCPDNRPLEFKRYGSRNDSYGYKREYKLYQSVSCVGCQLKMMCKKNLNDRPKQIQKNMKYEYFKAQTHHQLLDSKLGKIYSQRKIDVEPTFGHLKANLGFTRFHFRGKSKVDTELGFAFMALNIKKYARSMG